MSRFNIKLLAPTKGSKRAPKKKFLKSRLLKIGSSILYSRAMVQLPVVRRIIKKAFFISSLLCFREGKTTELAL